MSRSISAALVAALLLGCAPDLRAQPGTCPCGPECAGACVVDCPCAGAARAKARALFAFAKLDREHAAVAKAPACMDDLQAAGRRATAEHRPLLVWVGGCEGNEALRDQLPECIHCHAAAFNGNPAPRLVLPSPAGAVYLSRADLATHTAASIRAIIHPGREVPAEQSAPNYPPAAAPVRYTPVLMPAAPSSFAPAPSFGGACRT